MSELAEIKAELAELGAIIKRQRRHKRKDKRPNINIRLDFDEAAILDAACTERGMCRSDVIRAALNTMLGTSFPINRNIPPELRRWMNRHKPTPGYEGRNFAKTAELVSQGAATHIRRDKMVEPSPLVELRTPTKGMLSERRKG